MNMNRPGLRVLVVALMVLAGVADATARDDAFRCDGHLVRPGMPANDVIARCGRPDRVEVEVLPIMARRRNGTAHQVGTRTIEHWTYDRGPHQFPARVDVEQGVAVRIDLQY